MKIKMLVNILFLIGYCGFSQMVVNDPGANTALIKQLAQGVKTIEQTTKTVNLLKETKEMYDKVNSALQTFGYVSEMSRTTSQILENSGAFLQEIQGTNMFSNKEMAVISKQFTRNIEQSNNLLNVANDFLKGGMFKMNDAERLTMLNESKRELNEALIDTRIKRKKYLRIAEKRALRKHFANIKQQ